jgi:hypothetical protein
MDEREAPSVAPMDSLDQGIEPLRAWFEREVGHVRIVAIQLPT